MDTDDLKKTVKGETLKGKGRTSVDRVLEEIETKRLASVCR